MDVVGSAASMIAVIELSAKVASLCIQYSSAVKNAKADIERLQGEIERLETTLQRAWQLLESPNGKRLQASQVLRDGLSDCSSQLTQLRSTLEKKLNPGSARRAMSRLGLRALRWPFDSKEIDSIINNLEKYRDTLILGLAVDQVTEVLDVGQTLVLSKLPIASDAAFDSYADEHDTQCHPETRVDLLKDIIKWAEDPQGECIFWLNGMAGTGKSTISRTVAQSFADKGFLGASFFFKRGERDRSNAALLFTTIVAQLVTKEPALAAHVRAAIEAEPTITCKALKEQFDKLMLKPLENLRGGIGNVKTFVLVVDALDECERDNDIRVIISLLSQVKTLSSVRLRAFLTSRPELPIRLGFSDIKGKYQDLVLHEIPKPIIEHDIAAFLDLELAKIRNDYNALSPSSRQLPADWPGSKVVQALVQMAVPLFIFAATVCRFIREPGWDPRRQLAKVLQYQSRSYRSEIDKLDATYRPVLDRLLVGSKAARRSLVEEFRIVVGSIVLLAEPLPIHSLARLLDIPDDVVSHRLELLHSVISIPVLAESPVRIFHLSFRDFLVDPDKRDTNPFWVDEKAAHGRIATRCLELLSSYLRKDICDLRMLGMARVDVESSVTDSHLPLDIRYACLYWAHHIQQSNTRIMDDHPVYAFLERHFLHWLEALSLLGKLSESVLIIRDLQNLVNPDTSTAVSAFLRDANRFILSCHQIVNLCPLQIYSSAIIFAPMNSIIRKLFRSYIAEWILLPPEVDLEWNACLQTLEGHSNYIRAVAFSPDGTTLATGSADRTVRLWDTVTGTHQQTLEGHSYSVTAVAFSPDGTTLVTGSADRTVRLWDTVTGTHQQTLKGHNNYVTTVAFSPDGTTLATGSDDRTVRLWDTVTGTHQQTLEGHSNYVTAVAFSPDGTTLAASSFDGTVRLWDTVTGTRQQTRKGHSNSVRAVAFSPDGTTLATGSADGTVRLWDTVTNIYHQTLKGHSNYVTAVAFSPDGITLATGSADRTVRLWDIVTGIHQQTLKGHSNYIRAVAFSPDGTTLATGSADRTVRLWDIVTGTHQQTLKGHSNSVTAVAFSPDGTILATGLADRTVWLWDIVTGTCQQTLEGHSNSVTAVAFSPDGTILATSSADRTVQLWDAATGIHRRTVVTQSIISRLSFSDNGHCLETDHGLLRITPNPDASSGSGDQNSVSSLLFIGNNWIKRDGKDLIWLPPDYRPTCVAVHGHALALGLTSGRVCFFRFTFDR